MMQGKKKRVLLVIIFIANENSSVNSDKILLILQNQVQMSPPLCNTFTNSQSQIQGKSDNGATIINLNPQGTLRNA